METIGDAYCVAGNLHRRSRHHAQRVSWMALMMLDICRDHVTHHGKPIQVNYYIFIKKITSMNNLYIN